LGEKSDWAIRGTIAVPVWLIPALHGLRQGRLAIAVLLFKAIAD